MRHTATIALGLVLTMACGGSVTADADGTGSPPTDSLRPMLLVDGGVDAKPDADSCWRCADRAWRNVCIVPAVRGTDAESCVHCGEHCDSSDGG